MARQSEHKEELRGVIVDVAEAEARFSFFRRVNHAQQNRDADAVDDLGVAEIDHERAATVLQSVAAFALRPLAIDFVEIPARVNDRNAAFNARTDSFRAAA